MKDDLILLKSNLGLYYITNKVTTGWNLIRVVIYTYHINSRKCECTIFSTDNNLGPKVIAWLFIEIVKMIF